MEHMQLIVGMPSSGKSTFIAALGEVLISGDIKSKLTIKSLAINESHMTALQERWLTFQVLGRTSNVDENWLSFHVAGENNISSTIHLPDLSGEELRDAVVTGVYPDKLHQALNNCDGILLFTNANTRHDDVPITAFADILNNETTSINTKAEVEAEDNNGKPFDPIDMPEQPKLVQLLQTIARLNSSRQRRLAVMVSAWDMEVDQGKTPDEWFYENRSMLSQYLQFNPKLWDVRIYGVSAQGGVLPRDKERLQDILKPSERVLIVGHEAAEHDLTAPINWLMSGRSS
ncbi:MAG: TRAFAC clade GTPase domain-containing protein [Methylobacter sp.]